MRNAKAILTIGHIETPLMPPHTFDVIIFNGIKFSEYDKEWHLILTADSHKYHIELKMMKTPSLSKWWLIRKIQLTVLRYTFKNK